MSPSFATPDRTPLDRTMVADAALNETPSFPMEICYKNGYFAADPAIEYTPAVVPIEMVVKGVMTEQQYGQRDYPEQILGVCEAKNIIITHRSLNHHESGLASVAGTSVSLATTPDDSREYIYRIWASDKDNLNMTCQPVGGGDQTLCTLTVTDLFAGNPTFHFGYVKDKFYDAVLYDGEGHPGEVYIAAEGVMIQEFRAAQEGARTFTYTPLTAAIEQEDGSFYIGKLSAVDTNGLDQGYAFALAAGTGDTDNGDFSIPAVSGDKVYSDTEITDGVKYIRVSATDVYGVAVEHAFELTFGVNATPTNIALSDITYVASIMTDDPVATISTTDADPGDSFVYTLVAGTGDTNNDNFQIVGDELQAAVDFEDQVGTLNLRIRATDVGGAYFEKTFAVTVADDISPEMATFAITPATGVSYDVTPFVATSTDNVAVTHYMITETDVAPAAGAGGWVAAAGFNASTYSIVTQTGTGTYTLYCWAKDAAANVSATSLSDEIALTI